MKSKLLVSINLYLAIFPLSSSAQSWFSTYQNADRMISGVNFNNTGGPLSFNHPSGLATDGTRLLICDRFNNRVLLWNIAPLAWNDLPDVVIGQSDFISNNPGTSKSKLNWPGNASLSTNGVLVIADTDNDRVLIWNTIPSSNGQSADVSIHLPSLSNNWRWPWGVWTDGTRLAVVATTGHTLLFWDTLPAYDNQPPDYTIMLPQFGTPRNISTDGSTYFFVGDHNAIVNGYPGTFFWNSYPSSSNQPYDFFRNEWMKGTSLLGGQLIAGGLQSIYVWNTLPHDSIQMPDETVHPSYYKNGDGPDVVFANNKIYINNYNGNNILVYDSVPSAANPDAEFAIGVSDYYHNTLDSIAYIQNGVPASDGNRLVVTSDFDKRMYIFNTLPSTSGVFPDTIVSMSFPAWDNALFNNIFVAAGNAQVTYWNNFSQLTGPPSQVYNNSIGTAVFSSLKGVALDSQFFYLADQNGTIFIWNGFPVSQSVNPLYTINLGNTQLNRISSDGTYFCVTKANPPSTVYIYKVSEIASGNLTPWKTVNNPGILNMAADALAFNGSIAIANQANHNVLLWQDINNAGDTNSVIILGQPDLQTHQPSIGQNSLFMPASLLSIANNLWVGEFKFSSRILRFSFSPTGIQKNINSFNEVTCYPNPFHTSTILKVSLSLNDNWKITVYDLTGKEVFPTITRTPDSFNIECGNLSDGIYFYKLSDGNSFLSTGKLILLK